MSGGRDIFPGQTRYPASHSECQRDTVGASGCQGDRGKIPRNFRVTLCGAPPAPRDRRRPGRVDSPFSSCPCAKASSDSAWQGSCEEFLYLIKIAPEPGGTR
jgi:hypothetical protein